MPTVHLLTDLTWENCANRTACSIPHHLPNVTPTDANLLTRNIVIGMFALDQTPPTKVGPNSVRLWVDSQSLEHRDYDLPAVEYSDGGREWWVRGKRHRLGKPALTLLEGYEEWWVDDQLHRLDGPAVIYDDGTREWWLHGKQYTESDHRRHAAEARA